jgi:hypothetical protein
MEPGTQQGEAAMTVTLSPEQLSEETDVDTESETAKTEHTKSDVPDLGWLLAQAYVAMPLFA